MKTIRVLLFISNLVLATSCFEGEDIGRVLLTLPPASVYRVHIAVFEKSISIDNLLQKEHFGSASQVSLEVPAGENRIFLVVAENVDGYAERIAVSNPVTLDAGGTHDISLKMSSINWTASDIDTDGNTYVRWTVVAGNPIYSLEYDGNIVYEGSANETSFQGWGTHRVRAYFEIFDLYSDWGDAVALG